MFPVTSLGKKNHILQFDSRCLIYDLRAWPSMLINQEAEYRNKLEARADFVLPNLNKILEKVNNALLQESPRFLLNCVFTGKI